MTSEIIDNAGIQVMRFDGWNFVPLRLDGSARAAAPSPGDVVREPAGTAPAPATVPADHSPAA